MELRLPSATACPYLIVAALVAAGLDGLQRGLALPPPRDDRATDVPATLEEALCALETDAYMVNTLGSTLIKWYCCVNRAEAELVAKKSESVGMTAALQHVYMEYV